jgi:hypothetical protein
MWRSPSRCARHSPRSVGAQHAVPALAVQSPQLTWAMSQRFPIADPCASRTSIMLSLPVTFSRYARMIAGLYSAISFSKKSSSILSEISPESVGSKSHATSLGLGSGRIAIMPNRLHGIVILNESPTVKTGTQKRAFGILPAGSIAAIVRSFKSACAARIHQTTGDDLDIWQRNYYEHVIRDDDDFRNAAECIRLNPLRWARELQNEGRHCKQRAQHAVPLRSSSQQCMETAGTVEYSTENRE